MSPRLHRTLSDERLGGRLALGEAAAFDELYRRYVHRLAAYGTHLLGDAASGDDVAQVALMRAYQALRSGRAPQAVRPWLYRIAHNAAVDIVRGRQDLPTALLPERAEQARDPAAAGALVTAIAALPARQRRVYVLRELHGLRIDETAAELGLTAQQVEQSLFAARNRLAEQLVFGERLSCVAVRRLAAGPLDARERRALKTHLRSCPACRSELGARGIALTVLPAPSAEWLRGLLGVLGGGGTPVAAKVGAVVATATVAAGVPLAVDPHLVSQVNARPAKHVSHAPARLVAKPVAHTTAKVSHPVLAVQAAIQNETRHRDGGRSRSSGDSLRDGGGDGGTSGDGGATATSTQSLDGGTRGGGDTLTTTTTITTTSDGGGGGSGPDGGGTVSTDGGGTSSHGMDGSGG